MDRKLAGFLCKYQRYMEMISVLPVVVIGKLWNDPWPTDVENDGKATFGNIFFYTFTAIFFPIPWVIITLMALIMIPLFFIGDYVSNIPRIRVPVIYCPTRHPEKYQDKEE